MAVRRSASSPITPTDGSPSGGDSVRISGSGLGTNSATTRVTICGLSAQITAQSTTQFDVLTPSHTLANPAIGERCSLVVTRDFGLATAQTATSPTYFVYEGVPNGACNLDPTFYVSSLIPDTGTPGGGTVVTISGAGFPTNPVLVGVTFGGNPGSIVGTPANSYVQVSTPHLTLTPPAVSQTVDVVVTDLSDAAQQRCYRVGNAFIYSTQALDPSISSVSPSTGPNNLSTRVTMLGTNFQFPVQVFMTTATCGAQHVEASVISVAPSQIVFNTPIPVGRKRVPRRPARQSRHPEPLDG